VQSWIKSRAATGLKRQPGRLERSLLILVIVAGLLMTNSGAGPSLPRLLADDSVGDDLRAVAVEAWQRTLAVFRARSACFGDVRLHAAADLASRGSYDPATATVTVRVPATAAMLQSALIHEWAHHIEFQCAGQRALRPAFLAAQDLPAETPWRPDHDAPATMPESAWAMIPSEQYAEAVVELVLDRRPIPTTARVRAEAVQVIAAWAAGR